MDKIKQAPGLIQAGLFPGTLLCALTGAWSLINHGLSEELTLGIVMSAVFVLVAVAERLWPYHLAWNSNAQGDLQVDAGYFISNGIWLKVFETLGLTGALIVATKISASLDGQVLWPADWHWGWQLILAMLLGELVEYWWHRAMHEIPWAWRLHAVHHSAPRLYWLNALRFHPIDFVVVNVGRLMPAAILGADMSIMTLGVVLSGVHGVFQHANLQIRIGPLNWIFSMAELHRWHHSKTTRESNCNYGGNFIIWDIVFGTRFLPSDRQPPADIGIAGMPNFPTKFWEQQLSPFRWQQVLKENDKNQHPESEGL